jgi:hypothetical protein
MRYLMLKRQILSLGIWIVVLIFCALPALAEMIVDTSWVRWYNGSGNDDDYAYAIAIDGSGNVYVTGASIRSGLNDDYATIKYYPNGDTAWVRKYNGPAGGDCPFAIAVDGSGNVYVTGASGGDGTGSDYATVKYYSTGDTAWVRRYDGPASQRDRACDIAVDNSGNVYVTGVSEGSGTGNDYVTIKYDPNGNELWVKRYNGLGNGSDEAEAMAVDDFGNVYVTGWSVGSETGYDYATIKYYPDGDTAWVRRYNGPGNGDDYAYAIAVDGSGNVYAAGYSYGSGTRSDYATIKYDPNGNELWVERYNGPGNDWDWARAIALDDSGNACVTGLSLGSGTDFDYATIKYDPDGNELWARRYNGPANDADWAKAITVDDSRNVYVTGASLDVWTIYEVSVYVTIKYAPNGDELWVRRYNGPGHYYDEAVDIAVDNSNNVYVTGSIWIGDYVGAYDYATIKYFQALCGDCNGDEITNIADIVCKINYVFQGLPLPCPPEVVDHNGDGVVNVADVLAEINYLFLGVSVECPLLK